MYAVEKKYDIEMKLKKEMNSIQELKTAANRSSSLASDVCYVLEACEQRLQQLESAVLPLYGDTARLQQIHYNMERTVKSLDNVINYYMVAREMAEVIQAGPQTSTSELLNNYLSALDKLSEAQNYFNKNNPQSVELENINQLCNIGVQKLESAFEDLLSRNSRPLSPTTVMDMIVIEEDSSVESVSVSCSSSGSWWSEAVRVSAAWLTNSGRAPLKALLTARALNAKSGLSAFRDYLRTRSMGTSPLGRDVNLHRSDSTKKTSKIQKVIEKRANKIMMRASQTLEQSTGLAIGPRRSMNDSYLDEQYNEQVDESEVESVGDLASAICKVAKAEQRFLLGLVPLNKLPGLLAAILADCFVMLAQDVERVCQRICRLSRRGYPGSACVWGLVMRLTKCSQELSRVLHNQQMTSFHQIVTDAREQSVKTLDQWVEGVRSESGNAPEDGTVHSLAVASLAFLHSLLDYIAYIGPALSTEASYARAASQLSGAHDRDALMFAIYARKVLAQLNLTLRNKSEQYSDSLKAIFLLNNTLYLLQGLQRAGLLEVLMLAEPDCEMNYRDMIKEHKNAYLLSWNKLISHIAVEDNLAPKSRDKDRQVLKDRFATFNKELDDSTKSQRGYSVPDLELRETLKRDIKEVVLPPYTKFFDTYASQPFSKNPEKYVKYTPVQVAAQLDGYFDESA